MDPMDEDDIVGGGEAVAADPFEQQFEAAREEQSAPLPGPGEEAAEAPQRAPLPPEEIAKRWSDSKAALKEERRARQAEAQRAQALEARIAALYQQAGGGRAGPPDPRQDPAAALEWLHDRVTRDDAAWQAHEAQQQQQAEVQALTREFNEHEAEFREETPDYDDAVRFLRESRINELMHFGYSQAQAIDTFTHEALSTLRDVRAQNLNPARVAYGLARQRGFGGAGGGVGESAFDTIARGQAASKTLSGSGGRGGGQLTVEAVGNLKGAAFDTAFGKLMAQERERERRL